MPSYIYKYFDFFDSWDAKRERYQQHVRQSFVKKKKTCSPKFSNNQHTNITITEKKKNSSTGHRIQMIHDKNFRILSHNTYIFQTNKQNKK